MNVYSIIAKTISFFFHHFIVDSFPLAECHVVFQSYIKPSDTTTFDLKCSLELIIFALQTLTLCGLGLISSTSDTC